MPKFTNLADKIRQVRNNLGMTQKQFSELIGVKRTLVARWESPQERLRTVPNEVVLRKIANQTASPWQTLCWFMDDAVTAERGFIYYPDGTRILEPELSEKEVDLMIERHQQEADKLSKPDPKIAELIDSPNGLSRLYDFYKDKTFEKNIQAKPNGIPDNENIPAGTRVTIRDGGPLNKEGTKYFRSEFIISAPRVLADIAPGRNFEKGKIKSKFPRLFDDELEQDRMMGGYDEEESRGKSLMKFWGAVQYDLETEESIYDTDVYFNKSFRRGEIRAFANYHDGRILAITRAIYPDTPASSLKYRVSNAMGQLFIAEKVLGKTFKKLILFYSPTPLLIDTEHLREQFKELVASAQTLGVTIEFTDGARQTARLLGSFIRAEAQQE